MESLGNSCFFCEQVVPQSDSHINESITEFKESGYVNDDSSDTCKKTDRTCIFQIAHYLGISKSEANRVNEDTSKITICRTCGNLAVNLGNLCGDLEVIQLKIKYWLKLLTDHIIAKDSSKTQPNNDQLHLSGFQEMFHQKCILELTKGRFNPELRLTKCQTPKRPVKEEMFDNFDDHNDMSDNFEEDLDSNSVAPEDFSELPKVLELLPHFKCKYCPMTVSNRGNLEKHMKAVHSNKKSKHKIKTCEFCGAMMTYKSLYAHRRSVHGVGKTLPANLEIRKKKRCEICGKLISVKNVSKHRKFCESRCGKRKNVKRNLGDDAEDVEEYLIKKDFKCKKCNVCFERKSNLLRHFSQNEVCRGFKGNINMIEGETIIKCPNNCGQSFTLELCLKRHLKSFCKIKGISVDSNKMEIRTICDSEMGNDGNSDDKIVKEEKIDS